MCGQNHIGGKNNKNSLATIRTKTVVCYTKAMYRQGKYTRKRGPIGGAKYFFKQRWAGWKRISWKKKLLFIGGPIAAFLILTPIFTYIYYYNDIADVDKLLNKNNTGVVLMDKNGKTFFSIGRAEHRKMLPLSSISKDMQHALVASEDKDFYKHGGFSATSIVRAMYANIAAHSVAGGGSTITQQLAKNTLLNNQQTFLRKYQELTIAMAIEQRYSKDEILDMYLNSVYFGENSFGIEEAAKNYVNTTPDKLDLAQSAMIVGVLPAPSAYSPISGNKQYAHERQEYVLKRMVADGYITDVQKDAALKQPLAFAKGASGIQNSAPLFTQMIRDQLYKKYGEDNVMRSGFQVKTTLDLGLQDKANAAVAAGMSNVQSNGGSNASLVAIDPKTGGILAYVGSADYNNPQWGKVDMVQTARQPGSTFKPIYYSKALADGVITPTTVLKDVATDFNGYKPLNYDKKFRGNVTARQALDWSLNIPAVEVMQKYGIDKSIQGAKDLGITTLDSSNNYGLALAIGAGEVPLMQMTNAYAAFANSGDQYPAHGILSIEDKYNKTIFVDQEASKQAISPQGAYLISDILSDNATRARMFGSSLNVVGTDGKTKKVAVKTGTTDSYRDAWTIGYTSDIVVGVWTGNNDNTPMQNSGGAVAGPIWRKMMSQAIGASNPSFAQPSGITKATVCTDMGSQTDVFLSSNVPSQCKEQTPKDQTSTNTTQAQTTQKCTVAGKENLNADDPSCAETMCTIAGKTNLAANDPNCKSSSTLDADGDGVPDATDQCPNTPSGAVVAANGCSSGQTPTGTTPSPTTSGP